jgi:hypothetical protein
MRPPVLCVVMAGALYERRGLLPSRRRRIPTKCWSESTTGIISKPVLSIMRNTEPESSVSRQYTMFRFIALRTEDGLPGCKSSSLIIKCSIRSPIADARDYRACSDRCIGGIASRVAPRLRAFSESHPFPAHPPGRIAGIGASWREQNQSGIGRSNSGSNHE